MNKKEINTWLYRVCIWCMLMVGIFGIVACGSSNPIVGTWISEEDNEDIIVFEEDGSCLAPFTYNADWIESADRYVISDKTLIFSSEGGHANDSYEKADSADEALENSNMYYLSGDTLIIEGDTYTRS